MAVSHAGGTPEGRAKRGAEKLWRGYAAETGWAGTTSCTWASTLQGAPGEAGAKAENTVFAPNGGVGVVRETTSRTPPLSRIKRRESAAGASPGTRVNWIFCISAMVQPTPTKSRRTVMPRGMPPVPTLTIASFAAHQIFVLVVRFQNSRILVFALRLLSKPVCKVVPGGAAAGGSRNRPSMAAFSHAF